MPTTTKNQAIEIARRVTKEGGYTATASIHHGQKKEWAIRVTGTDFGHAASLAAEIQKEIPGSKAVSDAGFIAVWIA